VQCCAKFTIGSAIVLVVPMVLLGDEAQWMLVLICLEIVIIMTQDRCTVCAKRIIGSEIILGVPNDTPR
jgi:hypothetical protein